jgi:hypothetical protein
MMKIKQLMESVILASVVLLVSTTSQAASIRILSHVDGDPTTFGNAALVYNDADVINGVVTVFHPGSKVTVFGQEFGLDDSFSTTSLTVDSSGLVTEFNFLLIDGSPVDIIDPDIESISFSSLLTYTGSGAKGDNYSGTLTVSAVPLPASAWLFVSGLLGLVGMQRRKS